MRSCPARDTSNKVILWAVFVISARMSWREARSSDISPTLTCKMQSAGEVTSDLATARASKGPKSVAASERASCSAACLRKVSTNTASWPEPSWMVISLKRPNTFSATSGAYLDVSWRALHKRACADLACSWSFTLWPAACVDACIAFLVVVRSPAGKCAELSSSRASMITLCIPASKDKNFPTAKRSNGVLAAG